MAITSPQSALLAPAEFIGLSWVSLTKLLDAEIPSVHGFPIGALRWLGPLGAAVTQLVTITSYVVDL